MGEYENFTYCVPAISMLARGGLESGTCKRLAPPRLAAPICGGLKTGCVLGTSTATLAGRCVSVLEDSVLALALVSVGLVFFGL
jgi:hypothetical protein